MVSGSRKAQAMKPLEWYGSTLLVLAGLRFVSVLLRQATSMDIGTIIQQHPWVTLPLVIVAGLMIVALVGMAWGLSLFAREH
jgi:ABC-type sugar transport system permease subunit